MSYENALKREIFASLDRIITEIQTRFRQQHDLAEKFSFLRPSNLLDKDYFCNLAPHERDIDAEEFAFERKRLHSLVSSSTPEIRRDLLVGGPLELLEFIHENRLPASLPNIVIMLLIVLTVAISAAGCERSFFKFELMKNHLRSSGVLRCCPGRNLKIFGSAAPPDPDRAGATTKKRLQEAENAAPKGP